MTITFQVSPVACETAPLQMAPEGTIQRWYGRRVEALAASAPRFLRVVENGLLSAVRTAYTGRYPLVLSPDAIWLAIVQAFGPEGSRRRGVIRRGDFVEAFRDRPWAELFPSFDDDVDEDDPGHDLALCSFSTAGPCERRAAELARLPRMNWFYRLKDDHAYGSRPGASSLRGIPEVTLEGTVDDWRSLEERAGALGRRARGKRSSWVHALRPVLAELSATAAGRVDLRFWEALIQLEADGDGEHSWGGWIYVFFPHVPDEDSNAIIWNDAIATWQWQLEATREGDTYLWRDLLLKEPWSEGSLGISWERFEWHRANRVYPVHLLGGFMGVAQDAATLAVRPCIGWAICHEAEGASIEEQAVQWFLDYQARCVDGVALIAGWLSGGSLTVVELRKLASDIEGLSVIFVLLDRVPETDDLPDVRLSVRFAVGVRVAKASRGSQLSFSVDQLRGALRAAEDVRRCLAEHLPGRLDGEPALHLHGGALRFTARHNAKSFVVAEARSGTTIVDVSPEAHDGRLATARLLGFEESSSPYVVHG